MLLSKTLLSYRKYVHICSVRAAMNQKSSLAKILKSFRYALTSDIAVLSARPAYREDRANGFIVLKRKPFHSIGVAKAELLFNSTNAAGDEAMKILNPLTQPLANSSIDATVFLFIYQ